MAHYQETTTAPDSDHQNTREEIQSLYKKLLKGDILPENFFKESREFAKASNGYKNSFTEEAKNSYLNKHGNVVGVIGQAGVGKTTLSKILLSRILSEKENLYNADYIFYVKLRDFQNQDKIKLLNFLFKNITSDWIKTIQYPESFLDYLVNSNSVVIILDGLNEIDNTQFKDHFNDDLDMYDENSPLNFTLGLLSGQIFPKAKKIITSRPRQLLNLSPNFKPIFLVSIVGIDSKGQKQICENICKNHQQTQAVWNHVQNQPELNSYCYVPIMVILIFHTISQIFKSHKLDQKTPTSITQVLAYNFYLFICTDHVHKNDPDHIRGRDRTKIKLEFLPKLSKLAYEGIVHKKLYFSDDDFQAVGLNENNISTFFTTFHADDDDRSNPITVVQKITKKLSYFNHLIWQEFFAAIHIIFEFKETSSYINHLDLSSSQFEMVTKFLFGLCNNQTVEILKNIDDDYCFLPNHHASFLKEQLHLNLENIGTYSDTKHLFRFASLLYELKDKTLTREFSNLLPSDLVIEDDVFPNDVFPLCELIRARQLDLEISIRNVLYYKNSHLLFFKEMGSIIAESLHIKVKIYFLFIVS